jgi:hypothetical protein
MPHNVYISALQRCTNILVYIIRNYSIYSTFSIASAISKKKITGAQIHPKRDFL